MYICINDRVLYEINQIENKKNVLEIHEYNYRILNKYCIYRSIQKLSEITFEQLLIKASDAIAVEKSRIDLSIFLQEQKSVSLQCSF